jgi:site-specific DNA recombinase
MFRRIQEDLWITNGNSLATLRPALMVSKDGIMFTSSFCNGRWHQPQTPRLPLHLHRRIVMQIAIYARVSTPRQQQQQTIDQQLERLSTYVTQHPDWHLAPENIFRDDGYSGAKLNRPGLDRLRDRAALAAFSLVLITAPDRLARNYVHQVLLIEELTSRGCHVEFIDRPMSDNPHDQLLLQIRGTVAEYERSLIADRMRRGRQARLRAGQLLPWTKPLYGYQLDAEHPRDPSRVRIDPVASVIVQQIFTWYTESCPRLTLHQLASRLTQAQIPTPSNRRFWNVATLRGILRNPAYSGMAYSNRTHACPARERKSPLRPLGRGDSTRPAPPEDWIGVSVPAIISQERFDAAQARLDENLRLATRHNTQHQYLLRGLVSCGRCQLSCIARCLQPDYGYYVCRDKNISRRPTESVRCQSRYAPAAALDELVWQDLCRLLSEPELITAALQRAQAGEWLPQALQAQRQNLGKTLKHLAGQQARLLDLYLAEIIERAEFERKRQELTQMQNGLTQQLSELEAQAQKQLNVVALANGIEAFCQRLQPTLEKLDFVQRRQLVELLIDRVIINDGQVEVRYVIPTGPAGEKVRFCHLRKDYFAAKPPRIFLSRLLGTHPSIAQKMPDAPFAFSISLATLRHIQPSPVFVTVTQTPNRSPSKVPRQSKMFEFDPLAIEINLDVVFRANDERNSQFIEQIDQFNISKCAVSSQKQSRSGNRSQHFINECAHEVALITAAAIFKRVLVVGPPVKRYGARAGAKRGNQEMLLIFNRPVDAEANGADQRQLTNDDASGLA